MNKLNNVFLNLSKNVFNYSKIRKSITRKWNLNEEELISDLINKNITSDKINKKIYNFSKKLSIKVRNTKIKNKSYKVLQNLLQKFSLSSDEGISLMCLSEALLRIPDQYTRDNLIKDKIGSLKWNEHLSFKNSLFINLASWSLLITGNLFSKNKNKLINVLNNLIGIISKPVIRFILNKFMKLIGNQFITGENIEKALSNAKFENLNGFNYSYDMLGEAALTLEDSCKYIKSYKYAIKSIGIDSCNKGIYKGSGISIKLSALHPRYNRSQYNRVIKELYPILRELVLLACKYNVGINIDAEESDRLELSLDLLEKLCFEKKLEGWNGIGFVVQSYQKRCFNVVKFLIDLAKRSNHRLMIRLVKGAYWDTEIKRSQLDGLEGYPVYTRKFYTDVSYLNCAYKLLSFPNFIFPQFATHNAHTLASIYYMAGDKFYYGQYEFQCLHGMGNILYEKIVDKISRPCRIYAPVGTHKTLLSYLIRRLLENGANTSFVNRINDKSISIKDLIEDPIKSINNIKLKEGNIGSNPKIPLPRNIYETRPNSFGINLSNELSLISLSNFLLNKSKLLWNSYPIISKKILKKDYDFIFNPNNPKDIVGKVFKINLNDIDFILNTSLNSFNIWKKFTIENRVNILRRTAFMIENNIYNLISLLVRESGKTFNNAISEIREVIDFLHYYSYQVEKFFDNNTHKPLGVIFCISPWNFPLAIFAGQIAAALITGNSVIAKPSEQTPLIATQLVKYFIKSGLPLGVLQLLTGKGSLVGNKIINDNRISGVVFTGSCKVAKFIEKSLANRLKCNDNPITLIAETGGINTMIVDSSALIEQVVSDVILSAFDSAGQRCSALRLLCLQDDIADTTIKMLKGAINELKIGDSSNLDTDIGPVINLKSKLDIDSYLFNMEKMGFKIHKSNLKCSGNFVSPVIIELNKVSDLKKEVFGPVLHIVRYNSLKLDKLINDINKSGYGLTLGIQSRINFFIKKIVNKVNVGNFYINRNMIGAVVGVQPFGGEGLSGTGPKAGGPLYLYRLLSSYPKNSLNIFLKTFNLNSSFNYENILSFKTFNYFYKWLLFKKKDKLVKICKKFKNNSLSGNTYSLVGPTGEENILMLLPKKRILCIGGNKELLLIKLASIFSIGGNVILIENNFNKKFFYSLPYVVRKLITFITINNFLNNKKINNINAILYSGSYIKLFNFCRTISLYGPIVFVKVCFDKVFCLDRFLIEKSLSINTSAIGGNPNLLNIS